jgi:predicted nucleotidyltransferase
MEAIVLIGSAALGDYVHGSSDLDVAVIAPGPVGDPEAVAAPLRHSALPCPARRLELVVYRAEQAAAPTRDIEFELDLNTGEEVDRLLTELGDEAGHWYLIDLAIAHEHGRSLAGPPAGDVIGAPPHTDVIDALLAGLAWAIAEEPDTLNTVLNACRAWHFAETGDWLAKRAAGAWAAERLEDGILDPDRVATRARTALEAAR